MPVFTDHALCRTLSPTQDDNSVSEMIKRGSGRILSSEATIAGVTGVQAINVLQFTGSVVVMRQWAIITEVTTLTNMTDVHADVWDGTNSVNLTKSPGAILSGAPVGTFFTKDKVASETYTVNLADEVRFLETTGKAAVPFVVTQKNGADSFIRFKFTTTDNPISFKMQVWFEYYLLNGGTLAFL